MQRRSKAEKAVELVRGMTIRDIQDFVDELEEQESSIVMILLEKISRNRREFAETARSMTA